MTGSEKLQKVIEKAVENKFLVDGVIVSKARVVKDFSSLSIHIWFTQDNSLDFETSYNRLIFSHDFAKAFWGEVMVTTNMHWYNEAMHLHEYHLPAWQHHIQQLALTPEEDRINYLYSFV